MLGFIPGDERVIGCREPVRLEVSVSEAAAAAHLPEAWIQHVIAVESSGRNCRAHRPVRSSKGAIGLMQLMPSTWTDLSRTYGLGSSPTDPDANLRGGAWYLQRLYGRYGVVGMFAAYNAGPRLYERYVAGQSTLPAETRSYLSAIARHGRPVAPASARSTITYDRHIVILDHSAGRTLFCIEKPPPLTPGRSVSNAPRLEGAAAKAQTDADEPLAGS